MNDQFFHGAAANLVPVQTLAIIEAVLTKKESRDLGWSSEFISTITVTIKDGKAKHMRCI
jgi:hypothetical protein